MLDRLMRMFRFRADIVPEPKPLVWCGIIFDSHAAPIYWTQLGPVDAPSNFTEQQVRESTWFHYLHTTDSNLSRSDVTILAVRVPGYCHE